MSSPGLELSSVKLPVLTASPKQSLEGFLEKCSEIGDIDTDLIRHIATTTISYLRGDADKRQELQLAQELENRWYDSLTEGSPDWEVYSTDYYLGELWACWVVYSRQYIRAILPAKSLPEKGGISKDLGKVTKVVDLGCGCGYTTAALAEIFDDAQVIGTNIEGTRQMKMAKQMGLAHRFRVIGDASEAAGQTELVFASEYFEHIPAPIEHLRHVLKTLQPKALLIANAFGTRAIGHFEEYDVCGTMLDGKTTSKAFASELRRWGYIKVKTKLWNNRPAYWKKQSWKDRNYA